MFSVLIFILILSVMILVHEFGHFMQARALGIRVEKFSLGFGPKLFSFKRGFTEWSICLFAFGGYVKLSGDNREEYKGKDYEFLTHSPFERARVIFAGPFLNYALAFLCFWLVNIVGYPNLTTRVGEVMAGYPAEKSGILKGDLIINVDGKEIKYWQELQEIVYKKNTPKIDLTILRGKEKISLSVGLRQEVVTNILGAKQRVSRMGIRALGETVLVKHNIYEALWFAGKRIWDLTAITYMAIGRMLTGGLSVRESVTGPLGMFYVTSSAVSLGVSAVLHFMAILSASLAIFNLLPFPVLDGGHIFFLFLEKLRGRHLTQRVEEMINQTAVTVLIGLAILVFLNDLSRFGIWDKIFEAVSKIKW